MVGDNERVESDPTFFNKLKSGVEEAIGVELPDFKSLKIKNSVADIEDFPRFWYDVLFNQLNYFI